MKIIDKVFKSDKPFYLESGRILEKLDIAYSIYGEINQDISNIILVCHPLALDHRPIGTHQKAGWWSDLIGEKKALDTNKFAIMCINVLGSDYGSTSPNSINLKDNKPFRLHFPVVTIKDMVKAQKILLDNLKIKTLHAIIGGSMGGMQLMHFLIEYPNISKIGISLASTAKTRDNVIAYNKVIQESIIRDKDFKNGNYCSKEIKENGLGGLGIARMLGHITFLSPLSMQDKFKNEYVSDDGLYELFGRFQVERYLDYNGSNFSKKFDPTCYLYLAKAINIFDLARGYSSLNEAMSKIKASLVLLSFQEDRLFPTYEMQEIYDECKKCDIKSYYQEIPSSYGHDAFLVETKKFSHIVKQAVTDINKLI